MIINTDLTERELMEAVERGFERANARNMSDGEPIVSPRPTAFFVVRELCELFGVDVSPCTVAMT